MKLRLLFILLILFIISGCFASKKRMIKAPDMMVSLPEVRERIVAYHERGQYDKDAAGKAAQVIEAVRTALRGQVPYPAVVVVVEDVLLSTYKARKKQLFSKNDAAVTDLESHVILSTLPAVVPSLPLIEFLHNYNVPIFYVSYRSEGFRVPVMENLSKAGFSGWQKLYFLPPNYPQTSNYCEEVRKGLHGSGFNVIATIGALPEDISGEFAGTAVLYPNYIYSERK